MSYAKLSPPRTRDAIPRPRLFARLDELRTLHRVLWIHSPAGAGKTTLVTSYLQAANLTPYWYQIDEADSDPATLFHYLRQFVDDQSVSLPTLSLDAAVNLTAFARQFFRQFYAGLPPGAVLVFDNMHLLEWHSVGALAEIALSDIPEHVQVIVTSRHSLPTRLARLELIGQIGALDWRALRFDSTEARALIGVDKMPDGHGEAFLTLTDGWAAGIVILRQLIGSELVTPMHAPQREERETLFRYIASEIVERLPPEAQTWLRQICVLADITEAEAVELTGARGAGELLRRLYQDRSLIDRRGEGVPVYRFHALLREFLRDEAQLKIDPLEQRNLQLHAGRILQRRGSLDEAVALYREANALIDLAALLLDCAEGMLASGRSHVWLDWLALLPDSERAARPWLLYWQGNCMTMTEPQLSWQILEQADRQFLAAGDQYGHLLATAAMIDAWQQCFRLALYLPQEKCLAARMTLEEGLAHWQPPVRNSEIDLRLYSRLCYAYAMTDMNAAGLVVAAEATVKAMESAQHPAARLDAGFYLMAAMQAMPHDLTVRLTAEVNPLTNDGALAPVMRFRWCARCANWLLLNQADLAEAGRLTELGLQLARDWNLQEPLFRLQAMEIELALARGELERAKTLLAAYRLAFPSDDVGIKSTRLSLEAALCSHLGDAAGAVRHIAQAYEAMVASGRSPDLFLFVDRFYAVYSALAGDFGTAYRLFDERRKTIQSPMTLFNHDMQHSVVQAYECLMHGRLEDCRALLRPALSLHKRGPTAFMVRYPALVTPLLAVALDAGIETAHVRAIIRRQELPCPDPFSTSWPRPIVLRVFGELSLSMYDVEQIKRGRDLSKPILLLLALALAGEEGCDQKELARQLWPEIANPRTSLNVTIHRLREQLGNEATLIVERGRIALDTSLVWSDAGACDRLCRRLQSLPSSVDSVALGSLAKNLLALYRGPYAAPGDQPAQLTCRQQWDARFQAAVLTLVGRFEAIGAQEDAQRLQEAAGERALTGARLESER